MSILADRFREATSKMKDVRMSKEAETAVAYSTGFLNFDFRNGTVIHVESEEMNFEYYSVGIADGCMIMIIGRSGCGKTTWAIQVAANIAKQFKTSTIFHDNVEGGIIRSRIEQLTGLYREDLDDKYIARDTGVTAENFYERIKMIHDEKINNISDYEYDTGLYDSRGKRLYKLEPTIYILDSLAMLMPEKFTDEEEMSGGMSSTAAAKMNSMLFKRIVPMLKAANIILLIINHVNTNMSIGIVKNKASIGYLGINQAVPGGNTPQYLTNIMIEFIDNTKLKAEESFGIDGFMVDTKLIKSRSGKAGKMTTIVFNQDTGFDSELSLFIMLKNANRINGAGAYLYIDDYKDCKFSQKQFKTKLKEDPNLQEVFMNAVSEVLIDMITKDNYIEEEAEGGNISNRILGIINSPAVV